MSGIDMPVSSTQRAWGHGPGSSSMIISRVERRRKWTPEQKVKILTEVLKGASVSAVADRSGISRSQLYTWKKLAMTDICDEKLISLQFCHDVEKDALRVSFVVGDDVDVEAIAPGALVLTIVSQRIDDLFSADQPKHIDLGDGSLCTLAVRDPGGLVGAPGHEVLEVLIHELVERSWLESERKDAEPEE
jgi:hypothetical protein